MLRIHKFTGIFIALILLVLLSIGCEKGHTPSPPSQGTKTFPSMSLVTANNETDLTADGSDTVTFVAKVYKDSNILADDGTEVNFTTTKGTFSSGTTSYNAYTVGGIVTVTYTAGTKSGRAFIKAQAPAYNVAVSSSMSLNAGALAGVSIDSAIEELSADGTSTTSITARAVDAYDNLVVTTLTVTFTADNGVLTTTTGGTSAKKTNLDQFGLQTVTVTTNTGIATAILTAPSTTGTANLSASATVNGQTFNSETMIITYVEPTVGNNIYILSDKTNMGKNETATITITVTDKNNVGVKDATVAVSTTIGVITQPAATDTNGVTTATFSSMESEGNVVITVSYGTKSSTLSIVISSVATGDVSSIVAEAIPSSVKADGAETATIRAQVFASDGFPVADNTLVLFSIFSGPTDPGTISPSALTKCSSGSTITGCGIAEATYTSGTETGPVTVAVTSSGVTEYVTLDLLSDAGFFIDLTAFPTSLTANGADTSTIKAAVRDKNQNPVQGETITFATTLGSITPTTALTDAGGVATVTLTSSSNAGTAHVEASSTTAGKTSTTVVFANSAPTITLQASPSTIAANGTSTSVITATLVDGGTNNNPIPSQIVQFATDVGTITASATTNDSGIATATFTSVRREDLATITATYGSASDTIQVKITGVILTIEANPTSVLSNGTDASTVTITLKDASNSPIQSEIVTLTEDTSALGAVFTLTPTSGNTNIDGQVTATVTSTTSGDADIKATAAGASANTTVTFTDYTFTIAVNNSSIELCTGTTITSTVTVTLQDSNGTGVQNVPIDIYTTLGNIDGACGNNTPQIVTGGACPGGCTDVNGQKTFTLNPGTLSGIAQLTARAKYDPPGATPEISFVATTNVTIGAVTPAYIDLTVTPNRVAYNGSTTTGSAFVTDAAGNPVPNVLVSFTLNNAPGGGETLNPATAFTDSSGTATTTFTSGSLPSFNKGFNIQAAVSVGGGTISDQELMTIIGPPAHVNLAYELTLIDDKDATFKQWIAATVTDIYGNAVADGTAVTLGVREIGFLTSDQTYFATEDANGNGILDCEDTNSDCVKDAGEDTNGNTVLDCEDGSTGYLHNNKLDPTSSAVIPATSTTTGGVAREQMVYGQSDACWTVVRIDAESGGVVANGLEYTLPTTVEKGCPTAKYYSVISPATSTSYSIANSTTVILSISDNDPARVYTWTLEGAAAGTIDGGAGPVTGAGVTSVTYISPATTGTARTDTIKVTDCTGNFWYINITYP